jgi:hypothetical protein
MPHRQNDRRARSSRAPRTIDIHDPHAVLHWTRELEIDKETLKDAVDHVGARIERVREYLVERHFEDLSSDKVPRRLMRRASRTEKPRDSA